MTETKTHIRQEYDKFAQKTVTQTLKGFVVGDGTIKFGDVEGFCKIDAGLRHIKSPDVDLLVLDLYLDSKEWLFLRNGRLSLVIDSDNVSLECFESYNDTNSLIYQGVTEVVFYKLSKDLLKKICDSSDLAIRISGDKTYVTVKDKDTANFKIMCQQFYNNFYDQSVYTESLSKVIRPTELNKGGCFIATAAMGDYNHPVVMDLRLFRDNWLLQRNWGAKFTSWYYTHGPKAASIIEKSLFLRKITFYLIVKPLQYVTKKLR
jgi:hypothetical protein